MENFIYVLIFGPSPICQSPCLFLLILNSSSQNLAIYREARLYHKIFQYEVGVDTEHPRGIDRNCGPSKRETFLPFWKNRKGFWKQKAYETLQERLIGSGNGETRKQSISVEIETWAEALSGQAMVHSEQWEFSFVGTSGSLEERKGLLSSVCYNFKLLWLYNLEILVGI